jgi:phage terminase large subunit
VATTLKIKLAAKLATALSPALGTYAYRAFHGGRGSAKSFSVALMAAVLGATEPLRILCVREFQSSIAESFHAELKAAIASDPWLASCYDVGKDYLRGHNGTEFLFKGLRRNTQSIKSLAKIDLTIVEEAEDVPEDAWLALEATVFRQPKSELWAIWNPREEARFENNKWQGSPVDARFRKIPPPRSVVVEVNWRDNPFFPPGLQALREREQERLDPGTYQHIWEGGYLENSERQVLANKWRVAEFEPGSDWDGPYQGLDFGFNPDPLAGVRCWVYSEKLYVEYEAYKTGVEIDAMADFVSERIPGFHEYITRADSAEPKTISYAQRNGLPRIKPVKKWPNSVMEGVRFLRSFREIVVHSRCKNTITECRLYSHKVNSAGDVLPDLVDANNHAIDAIRYALGPLIEASGGVGMILRKKHRS